MNWYQELYLSPNLKGSEKYIHWLVESGWSLRPVYIIVLSELKDGQLEILPLSLLRLPFWKKEDYDILGVAKGYYHARSLVATILSDVYEITGDCDAGSFFRERMQKPQSNTQEREG